MAQSNIIKVNKGIGFTNVSFTPAFYKKAYKNYQNGDFRELLALIERAETHSFIAGCIASRQSSFKRKAQIIPVSDSAKDKEIAEWLWEVLQNLNFRELLEDMHDARMKYYSVLGLEWDVVAGKQVPVYYEKYEQKYFKYDPKDYLLKIDNGKTLTPIPDAAAFIIEASRKPIMLTVLKDFIRMEFGEEEWSAFLEVFGQPIINMEYPLGLNKDQIAEAQTQLDKAASSTRFLTPEGTKLNIVSGYSGAGATGYKDYEQDCKENISFALLGHKEAAGSDKSMQIGDTESSMVATTKTAEDDMYWLEEKIKPFIKTIVSRNYNVTEFPSLLLDKSTIIDPKTKLTAAQLASEMGAEIDPVFFKEYGIPVVNNDPLKKKSFSEEFGGGF